MKKLLLLVPAFALVFYLCQAQTPRDAAIGCWEMPSHVGEHLQTYRNGEFAFHDYNSKTGQWDDLTGKWDFKGGKLTLLYFDRPKQTFSLKKHGNTLSLTKPGGFELAKPILQSANSPGFSLSQLSRIYKARPVFKTRRASSF